VKSNNRKILAIFIYSIFAKQGPPWGTGGANVYSMVGNDSFNSQDSYGLERVDGALIGVAEADGEDDTCCSIVTTNWKVGGGSFAGTMVPDKLLS